MNRAAAYVREWRFLRLIGWSFASATRIAWKRSAPGFYDRLAADIAAYRQSRMERCANYGDMRGQS